MVLAEQKTCPPSLCSFITLITYLFSLLPFTCLACLCASLCLCTIALIPYPTRCVGSSTYVIKSFLLFHSTVAPIIFILVCSKCFHQSVFYSSTPWVLSPIFHLLPYPSPSWLPSASLLLCLLVVVACEPLSLRNCPCQFVRVSWAEGVLCLFATPQKGRVDR